MNSIVNPVFEEKDWLPDREPCSPCGEVSDWAAIIPPASQESGSKAVKNFLLILVALACLLSLASLGVSLLHLLGKIQSFEGCECPLQNEPQQPNVANEEFQKRMDRFQSNLTAFKVALQAKTSNYPTTPSSSGKTVQSQPGFRLCQYQNMSVDITPANATKEVLVAESDSKRIMSATCSTNQAAEVRFSSFLHDNKRKYRCECKGISTHFHGDRKTYCYLHYWECPLT